MPHIYTRDEKADMLIIYEECRKNAVAARNLYADRYPDRQCPARNYFIISFKYQLHQHMYVNGQHFEQLL